MAIVPLTKEELFSAGRHRCSCCGSRGPLTLTNRLILCKPCLVVVIEAVGGNFGIDDCRTLRNKIKEVKIELPD